MPPHSNKGHEKILFILALLQTFMLSCYSQPAIHYGNNPAAVKYYNGIKIYCEIYGQGKPLLMIHGNGGSIASFSKNIPYFSKNYMVMLPDSRAQGKSTGSKDSLSFEMMADDFNALLDTLHIQKTYVIGWSDGGINALLLAMRHPDKVIKPASTDANLMPGSTALAPSLWKEMEKQYAEQKDKKRATAKEKND